MFRLIDGDMSELEHSRMIVGDTMGKRDFEIFEVEELLIHLKMIVTPFLNRIIK